MAVIYYEGKAYQCESGESVLDTLLRNQVELNYGCQAGACQSCMLKAKPGSVPEQAQQGIKETLKAQGYFLACCCVPEQDLEISGSDDVAIQSAVVEEIHWLSGEVIGVKLKPDAPLVYLAGQFINLHKAPSVIRSYSLASVPTQDEFLQLHVRRIPEGEMSGWVADELKVGSRIEFDGPHGDCFYTPDNKQQPLLLIGTGTGLAPLYGILRDALQQGHQGDIHLFHGSKNTQGLYLVDELKVLADTYPHFYYTPSLSAETVDGVAQGRALDMAIQHFPSMSGMRIFLCGNPEMVQQAKKQAFLAGANMREIYADPFTYS